MQHQSSSDRVGHGRVLHRRRVAVALALAGLLSVPAVHEVASATTATEVLVGQQTFGCSGSPQNLTAPPNATAVIVTARGASGRASLNNKLGGFGAIVSGEAPLSGGEAVQVNVGCTGGWNGGGAGNGLGGTGGGASDVRVEGVRKVVAGGGGGGGELGAGGSASAANGGSGVPGVSDGRGATTTSGGHRGGALAVGGHGESDGGGGGGGLYGGGGSGLLLICDVPVCTEPRVIAEIPGGGGGAGSSLVPPGGTVSGATAFGHGSVTVAFRVPGDDPSTTTSTTTSTTSTSTTTSTTTTLPAPVVLAIALDAPATIEVGATATVTATVTDTATGLPVATGQVTFTGAAPSPVAVDANGKAQATVTAGSGAAALGPRSVTATYDAGQIPLADAVSASATIAVVDTNPPTVTLEFPPAPASGWFVDPVAATLHASDAGDVAAIDCTGATVEPQGIGTASATASVTTSGEGETTVTCTVTDASGHDASASGTVSIDTIDPTITWSGGPADGGTYPFGSVPGAPSCTATDDGSGPDGCVVAGYATTVGTHVVMATAVDVAGNEATATRTYTVTSWQLQGFYSPVDMGGVVNTVKGGSTVPLEFEVLIGGTEHTSTSVVQGLRAVSASCATGTTQDEIEVTAAGSTALRYDATEGVFIYNWRTPKTPGACLDVIVQTLDGSTITARFRLR